MNDHLRLHDERLPNDLSQAGLNQAMRDSEPLVLPDQDLHNRPGTPSSFIALGNIVLAEAGPEACQAGYGTTDPEWVGRYAIEYGDIQPDGTLN